MGSVFTCKLNPCCGNSLNCNPPVQSDGSYWDGKQWHNVKERENSKASRTKD